MLFARLKRIMKLDHLANSTAGTADRLFAAEPTFSTESAGFSQMRQAAFGRFLSVVTGRNRLFADVGERSRVHTNSLDAFPALFLGGIQALA
jgi:hypothetical protein